MAPGTANADKRLDYLPAFFFSSSHGWGCTLQAIVKKVANTSTTKRKKSRYVNTEGKTEGGGKQQRKGQFTTNERKWLSFNFFFSMVIESISSTATTTTTKKEQRNQSSLTTVYIYVVYLFYFILFIYTENGALSLSAVSSKKERKTTTTKEYDCQVNTGRFVAHTDTFQGMWRASWISSCIVMEFCGLAPRCCYP